MSTLSISAPGVPNEVNIHRTGVVIATPELQPRRAAAPALAPVSSIAAPRITTTLSPAKTKSHVIVVGGGISGLRAASVLLRHGVKVTLLEGRSDRLGGRIYTSRKHGKAARDIGAAWMHETSQNKLVQLIPKLGIEYYFDDGTPLYYTRDGKTGSQFKAKKVADEFADYVEAFYEANPDEPDRSVKEVMDEWVEGHLLVTPSERKWAPQAAREVELWVGTSLEEASAKHLSYYMTERNLYMKGGYDKIVNWTAAPLFQDPDIIHLGHVVQSIEWGTTPGSVTARTQDASFTADAVIVTIPLGCLRAGQVSFTPALPPSIQTGLQSFSYGALGKVFIEFTDLFWPKDNDQFIYYPSPVAPGKTIDPSSILSYATVTSNLWIMSGKKELCVQISEPLTQRIEALTSDAEIYAFFEPLFKLFRTEPHIDLPDYSNLETTHWTQDPLAGFGSYSVEKVGDEPGLLVSALEEHKGGRLQFAGEHCIEIGNGCVHGAFETGEVAAKRLLEGALGMGWDGKGTTARSVSP